MLRQMYRQCDFKRLMELYETNYFLLSHLIPDLRQTQADMAALIPNKLILFSQVLETSKYTKTLYLTHYYHDLQQTEYTPGLILRAFFDSQQAEVLSWTNPESFAHINKARFSCLSDINNKWQVNYFLAKWLQYCLQEGYLLEYHLGWVKPQPSQDVMLDYHDKAAS